MWYETVSSKRSGECEEIIRLNISLYLLRTLNTGRVQATWACSFAAHARQQSKDNGCRNACVTCDHCSLLENYFSRYYRFLIGKRSPSRSQVKRHYLESMPSQCRQSSETDTVINLSFFVLVKTPILSKQN